MRFRLCLLLQTIIDKHRVYVAQTLVYNPQHYVHLTNYPGWCNEANKVSVRRYDKIENFILFLSKAPFIKYITQEVGGWL